MSKVKQSIISLIMLVFVLFSAFSLVACGEEDGGNDDDTPVIDAIKWTGAVGALPDAVENVIEIENGEQLAGFAKAVNDSESKFSFSGYTIKLVADINLDNIEWTPIGNNSSTRVQYVFSGIFDGNEHTIYNLKVSANSTKNEGMAGLFGALIGEVKNLTIKYATITSTHYAAGVVAYITDGCPNANIRNCKVENATITSGAELINDEFDNGDKVGGIIGYSASAIIENCQVENTVITGYRDLGGIIGCAGSTYMTVRNNSIKNVIIKVDTTHNYKNYVNNEEYNANSIIGRDFGVTNINNTGVATIQFMA